MALESAVDTTFSIRYARETDRFSIEAELDMPPSSIARLGLGTGGEFDDDFILFDNEQPGSVRSVSHSGQNRQAITKLTRSVFDRWYEMLCESVRAGALIYDTPETTGVIIVPYANSRRLGRIALHAQADNASPEVIALQRQIDSFTRTTNGDDGGGYQPLSA